MRRGVAGPAQCHKVFFAVPATGRNRHTMVDFQPRRRATQHTSTVTALDCARNRRRWPACVLDRLALGMLLPIRRLPTTLARHTATAAFNQGWTVNAPSHNWPVPVIADV
jgi:hypothetical protein